MAKGRKKPTKAQSAAAKKKAKRKKKKHAKFLSTYDMLAFARSHPDCGNTGAGECSSYNTKLGSPPSEMNKDYEAAVHHVLPVSAVIGFMKKFGSPDLENIASVYGAMDWCINKKANLIWLPYFPAYQRHLYLGQPGSAPSAMAAHNFDHNPHYNDLVIKVLQPIWDSIAEQTPTENCDMHKELVKTLDDQIPKFKRKLKGRGTQRILDRVHELKGKGKKVKDLEQDGALKKWWTKFSMSPGNAKERSYQLLYAKPPRLKVLRAIKRSTEANS